MGIHRSWHLVAAVLLLVGSASVGSADAPRAPSPESRLSAADSSSEYWDFSVRLESGHRVFARFSISNEGPGDHTAYAIGQIVFPDGRIIPFQNGRRMGDWSLSDDGLLIEIGSSVLDLHAPLRRFSLDKNRRGQKVFLDFAATPDRARAWDSAPPAYDLDLLQNGTPVSGTLWVRGILDDPLPVQGLLTATHTWMDITESDATQRRVEFHGGGGTRGVYLIDALSPQGESKRWLVVEEAGAVVLETDDFEIEYAGTSPHSLSTYPVPATLVVRGPKVNGTIELGVLRVRHDPLAIAPQPFRWLLSFKMEPDHGWFEATCRLVIDGKPVETPGVVSVFHLNKAP